MSAIDNLTREALLDIGEAVDLIVEVKDDIASGHGDPRDLAAYTNRLNTLCAENGVNPADAMDTFA